MISETNNWQFGHFNEFVLTAFPHNCVVFYFRCTPDGSHMFRGVSTLASVPPMSSREHIAGERHSGYAYYLSEGPEE
jgi:hypothetical protein